MPHKVFYVVCSVFVIGIIIGSFYDYQISVALSNTTGIGDFYQHYGNIISHLLYVIAGVCLFKGLKKKRYPPKTNRVQPERRCSALAGQRLSG